MAQGGTSEVQLNQTAMGQEREAKTCSDPQKRNVQIPLQRLMALPARCGIPVDDICGVSRSKRMSKH